MPFERSIASCIEAMKMWDYNTGIDPESISKHSKQLFSWVCEKNHRFKSSFANMARLKSGCQICYSLAVVKPEIAKEWHPTKNNELTPRHVKALSNKKVWWLCSNGHAYGAYIFNRTRGYGGCPKCRKPSEN